MTQRVLFFFPFFTLEIKPEGMSSTKEAVFSLEGRVCISNKTNKNLQSAKGIFPDTVHGMQHLAI